MRSTMEYSGGTEADLQGTIKPQVARRQAAQTDLRTQDLPPPLGPVRRNVEDIFTVFSTTWSWVLSIQAMQQTPWNSSYSVSLQVTFLDTGEWH
ncbi:hypothetical protein R1flu_024882 [Riccia fluitans]|uniref:Uncharacterized protein n=1 Tax=Riccia fluitans TaxID=41844 RepID=A0ABD1XW66_9MARC